MVLAITHKLLRRRYSHRNAEYVAETGTLWHRCPAVAPMPSSPSLPSGPFHFLSRACVFAPIYALLVIASLRIPFTISFAHSLTLAARQRSSVVLCTISFPLLYGAQGRI